MNVNVDGGKTVGAMALHSGTTYYTLSGGSITLDKSGHGKLCRSASSPAITRSLRHSC